MQGAEVVPKGRIGRRNRCSLPHCAARIILVQRQLALPTSVISSLGPGFGDSFPRGTILPETSLPSKFHEPNPPFGLPRHPRIPRHASGAFRTLPQGHGRASSSWTTPLPTWRAPAAPRPRRPSDPSRKTTRSCSSPATRTTPASCRVMPWRKI